MRCMKARTQHVLAIEGKNLLQVLIINIKRGQLGNAIETRDAHVELCNRFFSS